MAENEEQTEQTDKPEPPKPVTKVVIVAPPGVVVNIESIEPLDTVLARAQEAHREVYARCVRPLPDGVGGYL